MDQLGRLATFLGPGWHENPLATLAISVLILLKAFYGKKLYVYHWHDRNTNKLILQFVEMDMKNRSFYFSAEHDHDGH